MLIFFVGSYTTMLSLNFGGSGQGIYTVAMDVSTGKVKVVHTMKAKNPSYLTMSGDNRFLYAITEVSATEEPKVQAYAIREDYSLEPLNEQPLLGEYPCHITYSKHGLIISNYGSGTVEQFPVAADGRVLPRVANFKHSGFGINAERQEGPHAHQAFVLANQKDVFVADLGIDMLKAYEFDDGVLVQNASRDVHLEHGGGPRHMVFDAQSRYGYVVNELTGVISVLNINGKGYNVIHSYNSLPNIFRGKPSSSAIRLHPNGEYLYVANRELDALTIFRINEGELKLVDYVYTEGETIREFNISPDGKWLIACHQDSDDLVVYSIMDQGKLEEQYRTKEVVSPVCVVFIGNR